MSLQPGQIISTDLSPNANISGFQIADKTLQLRNFADGVIPASALSGNTVLIVAEGPYTTSLSVGSVSNGLTKTVTATGTFTKSYSTIPIVLGFTSDSGGTHGVWAGNSSSTGGAFGGAINPYAVVVGSGANVIMQQAYSQGQTVTTTNVTFSCWFGNGAGSPVTGPTFTILWYVLQQKAA